jgi:hypothetical protein
LLEMSSLDVSALLAAKRSAPTAAELAGTVPVSKKRGVRIKEAWYEFADAFFACVLSGLPSDAAGMESAGLSLKQATYNISQRLCTSTNYGEYVDFSDAEERLGYTRGFFAKRAGYYSAHMCNTHISILGSPSRTHTHGAPPNARARGGIRRVAHTPSPSAPWGVRPPPPPNARRCSYVANLLFEADKSRQGTRWSGGEQAELLALREQVSTEHSLAREGAWWQRVRGHSVDSHTHTEV